MKTYMIPQTEMVALDSETLMLDMPVVSGGTQEQPSLPPNPAPGRVTILSSNGKVF